MNGIDRITEKEAKMDSITAAEEAAINEVKQRFDKARKEVGMDRQPENFFYEDEFHTDLESLISTIGDDFEDFKDDWSIKVELTDLEPIFDVTVNSLCSLLADNNEERLTDNFEEEENIKKALSESIDFEKLKSLLPKYCYPNGKFEVITKQDLLDTL